MSSEIHATAIVADGARLGEGCRVGPYCVIGPKATLGNRVVLESHVVVDGDTTIGDDTHVFPFASIGHIPQDLKFHGENSRLVIGARNRIREYVTMNPGTEGGGLVTTIGDDCLFMAGSHVAHDCHIGNHVILVNNATVGGHCTIGDFAILGGISAVHQFVRIGEHAFIGGMSGAENDVIPFGTVIGARGGLAGLNIVGLKRRGFERDRIHALRHAYKKLFAEEGTLTERVELVAREFAGEPLVQKVVDFIRAESGRSLCTPRSLDD